MKIILLIFVLFLTSCKTTKELKPQKTIIHPTNAVSLGEHKEQPKIVDKPSINVWNWVATASPVCALILMLLFKSRMV